MRPMLQEQRVHEDRERHQRRKDEANELARMTADGDCDAAGLP